VNITRRLYLSLHGSELQTVGPEKERANKRRRQMNTAEYKRSFTRNESQNSLNPISYQFHCFRRMTKDRKKNIIVVRQN